MDEVRGLEMLAGSGRIFRDTGKGGKWNKQLQKCEEKATDMSDRRQVLALGCCYLSCTHSVHHFQYVSKCSVNKKQIAAKNWTCWQSLSAQTLDRRCSCVHKSDDLLWLRSITVFECVFTVIFMPSMFLSVCLYIFAAICACNCIQEHV